jgi:hypothetical protein
MKHKLLIIDNILFFQVKPQPCKPYWRQQDLFSAFNKHHIAVFSINFAPNEQLFVRILKDLQDQLRYSIAYLKNQEGPSGSA